MDKKQKHDPSPDSLELPKHKGGKSKRIYNIITAVLGFMALIVVWSFVDTGDDDKKKQEEIAARETMESRGLMPGEEVGRGLAASFPKPPENSAGMLPPPQGKEKDDTEMKFVGPPIVDQGDEARRLEEQEDRRRKKEAHYAGLGSGIMVRRANQNSTQATPVSSESGSGNDHSYTPAGPDAYDPAADRDKEAFFERADTKQWMSPYTREAGHQFEMKTGTVISGIMVTGINSDLPGNIIAQVSQNIYDTASGKYLLIPQGSKIYGAYDSRVVYGQSRVLVAWNRVIFPDGSSVTLGAMPGADMAGYAGFNDEVDNHYLRIFGSAIMMSLVTGGTSYAIDKVDNNNKSDNANSTTMQDEMASALAAQMGQTSMKLLEKNMSIKPTLGIRPGYRFNIVVTKDVVFRGPYAAQ